jgi:uncharacterized membrane protein
MTIFGMDWQDSLALVFFVICWIGYAGYSERENQARKALVNVTNHWRLQWMREMLGRENRSVDAITVGNLTRSFTFFASTTMFILAALVSMLGYRDRANAIFAEIPFAKLSGEGVWQMKIMLLIIIFTYGFFKFTWSMRQYNYVSIFIAAVPDYRARKDEHDALAARGAALTGNAARHFNNGLRAYYFGLAILGWFIHPYIFMAATALVVRVTYRREYLSSTLKHLSV